MDCNDTLTFDWGPNKTDMGTIKHKQMTDLSLFWLSDLRIVQCPKSILNMQQCDYFWVLKNVFTSKENKLSELPCLYNVTECQRLYAKQSRAF